MENDLLDDFESNSYSNSEAISRILQITLGTLLLFFLMESFKDHIPKNIYEKDNLKINTAGFIVFLMVIFQSMSLPTYLNKVSPQLNVFKVIIYTGIIIFTVHALYWLIQFNLIHGYDFGAHFFAFLKSSIVLSMLGALIALIRIRKLRQKAIWILIALFICAWILIGLFITKS